MSRAGGLVALLLLFLLPCALGFAPACTTSTSTMWPRLRIQGVPPCGVISASPSLRTRQVLTTKVRPAMAIFPADFFPDVKAFATIGSIIVGSIFTVKKLAVDPSFELLAITLKELKEGQTALEEKIEAKLAPLKEGQTALEKKIEEGQTALENGQKELKTELISVNTTLAVVDSRVQGLGNGLDKLDDRCIT
mmetsp:Transcript_18687/g.36366  ORF Transcript_18687/g.36366 Transcript_18687/m.36366 type:complete len:193 (-) Transcript_18687:453-1031(-)